MRSSLSRVATTILVGVLVIACAPAASPAPTTMSTSEPESSGTSATASPRASDTQRYLVDAHFDDEAAPACGATIRAGNEPRELQRVAEYWCRTTLVVERLTPAGRQ